MNKTQSYFMTFGQNHTHSINGRTFDKDTVGEIKAETIEKARQIAFDVTDGVFATIYKDEEDLNVKRYFPKGILPINF